jgi:uncharacterized protein (TIGR04141 family)
MTRRIRARSLNVFLLKHDIRPDVALMSAAGLSHMRLQVSERTRGDLYVKPSPQRIPYWWSLFEPSLGPVPADVRNSSSAAVLFLVASERLFALTFGYGRTLLRPGTWEEDFGLRATLNAVDPLRIRSVDRVKFDAISQHSQIQASRDADIVEFGLDVEQDLLRAVTGKPRDSTLASQLTGKDALKADVRVNLSGIPDLLARFLVAFGQETYKENFPWVDHINEVRDVSQRERLDAILVERIAERNFERLWLAIPDRVDWEGMAGFKYRDTQRAAVYDDVYFPTFLEQEGSGFVATIDTLKNRRRIYLVSLETDLAVEQWPLYRCIYCEIDVAGETFLLNNGKWYRISTDFLQSVNNSFEVLREENVGLPNYLQDSEAAYNQSVADTQPDQYCLMDGKLIRLPGRDEIEFCDLYSVSKTIIHVKRYRGSATLSHLFSQGVVSGELFRTLPDFRVAVNGYLLPQFRFRDADRRPSDEEFKVMFGIVSKSRRSLTLPFFSRVNLRNAAQRLKAFGYRVAITKILATEAA